jgi:acid stress chaperone HdeA
MKRLAGVLFSALVAGAVLAGCSPAVTGGDTRCEDFVGSDEKTQNDAVAKMLKDEKGADAPQLEVTAVRLSALTFCQTVGKQDSKLKEAPHL